MAKLYLLRHLKSQWNKDDRFAGWVDNPLSEEGKAQAKGISEKMDLTKVDVAYAGTLMRVTETVLRIFDYVPETYPLFKHMDGGKMQTWANFVGGGNFLPVYLSDKLNERYYGDLQGLNKAETAKKYGAELVYSWRRGYATVPPGGESTKDTYERVFPFYEEYILRDLKAGKNVLVAASGNSLRAIIKHIDNIPDDQVSNLELEFGALVEYDYHAGNFVKK